MVSFDCSPRPPRAVVAVDLSRGSGRFSLPRAAGAIVVTPCVMSVMPSLLARRAAWRMSAQWREVKQPRFAAAALGFTEVLIVVRGLADV